MRLLPLGVGDAFSALHYSTCFALESGDRWLLVDCPHPIRKILREGSLPALGRPLDVGDLEAVVLTHLHADHCSGVEGLGFFAHFALHRRMRLVAHPEVSARLWESLAPGMERLLTAEGAERRMTLESYFEPVHLSLDGAVNVGPFSIQCRRTWHHIPTTALRIRAGGRTLGHSADTRVDRDLLGWLMEADLVLHETGPGVHAAYETLASVMTASQRTRVRLIHYPDDLADRPVAIARLRQGELIEV